MQKLFKYKIIVNFQPVYKKIIASSKTEAMDVLHRENIQSIEQLYCLNKNIELDIFVLFFMHISLQHSCGITLEKSIYEFADMCEHDYFAKILYQIAFKLENGYRILDAFKPFCDVFGKIIIGILGVTENNGDFSSAIDCIINFLKFKKQFQKQVQKKLYYPIFVFCVAIVSLFLCAKFLAPQLEMINENACENVFEVGENIDNSFGKKSEKIDEIFIKSDDKIGENLNKNASNSTNKNNSFNCDNNYTNKTNNTDNCKNTNRNAYNTHNSDNTHNENSQVFSKSQHNICTNFLLYLNSVDYKNLFIFFAFFIFAIVFACKNKNLQSRLIKILFKIPFIKQLIISIFIWQLSNIIYICLRSKIKFEVALEFVKDNMFLEFFNDIIKEIFEMIKNGHNISDAFASQAHFFPQNFLTSIKVAESSNNFTKIFTLIAENSKINVEMHINGFTQKMMIFTTLLTGAIFIFMVLSMFLPMYELCEGMF